MAYMVLPDCMICGENKIPYCYCDEQMIEEAVFQAVKEVEDELYIEEGL